MINFHPIYFPPPNHDFSIPEEKDYKTSDLFMAHQEDDHLALLLDCSLPTQNAQEEFSVKEGKQEISSPNQESNHSNILPLNVKAHPFSSRSAKLLKHFDFISSEESDKIMKEALEGCQEYNHRLNALILKVQVFKKLDNIS